MHVQGCMCVCLCVHIYVQMCMQVCMRGFGGQWSTSAVISHPIWLLNQEFSRTWNLLSRPCWLGSKPQRSDRLYLTLWLYTQVSHIGIHGVYVNAEDENQVFVIARQALFRLSYLPELRKLKFFNIGRGNPFWILSTTVSQILERYMPVSLDPDLASDSIPAFCFLFRSEQHQTFSFLPLPYWFSPWAPIKTKLAIPATVNIQSSSAEHIFSVVALTTKRFWYFLSLVKRKLRTEKTTCQQSGDPHRNCSVLRTCIKIYPWWHKLETQMLGKWRRGGGRVKNSRSSSAV